ncbi:hypothetical protein QAD02_011797 [Eretmocerus hayati]|uniref:Uncharacterized protein n=1 Tax=Eretmocerus hayati TaxID=131215 RepID=A0ACC2NXY5_9HYME|nr:hypothetical protein QAD02_011797 [Eretmocerus hayati]
MVAQSAFVSYIVRLFCYEDPKQIDTDTNEKIDLLNILPGISKKDDPYDNWKGRWFPSRSNEWTPPAKIAHKNSVTTYTVPMGVEDPNCDDGKTNLTVDWDKSTTSYECAGQKIQADLSLGVKKYHQLIPVYYRAMHACMSETIEYKDKIPLYGTHRAIWPVYGEYVYVPKQRWLHSLEHGAVVMLYHPCADSSQVEALRKLVKSCLWRHIITPYNELDVDRPLALLTWGYRMSMSHVDKNEVKKFIRKRALRGPEEKFDDGHFDDHLMEKARIVSDAQDSQLCPESHM